jgi:2'-hydroxyisoflavone reductase
MTMSGPSRRELLLGVAAVLASGCGRGGAAPRPAGPPAGGSRPIAKKRILILGGTGFLGPALVEAARAAGHELTLFNRGRTNPRLFREIEQIHGDRRSDLSGLRGRKWDLVIDTSSDVPKVVGATGDLLRDAVERYVFVSTISVYATPVPLDGPDETATLARLPAATVPEEMTPETYGAIKALDEQTLERSLPGRLLVIRPGLIVGPGDRSDRFTYWPTRLMEGGEVLAPGAPSDPIQLIDVRDLAEWTIAMGVRGDVGVFNAVGPRVPTGMGELLAACQQGIGSSARLTWVSADFLEQQKVAPWSDMPVWVPSVGEDAGLPRTKATRAVDRGLTFRTLQATAKDTLDWYRSQPPERRAKPKAGLAREREAAVLAAYHRAYPAA